MITERTIGRSLWLALATLTFSDVQPVAAHDPGFSTLHVRLRPDSVDATLTLALLDVESFVPLDNDFDGKVSQAEFAYGKSRLAKLAAEAVVVSFDQRPSQPSPADVGLDDQNNVTMRMSFPGQAASEIAVQAAILGSLAPGHRELFTLEDPSGKELDKRLLSEQQDTFTWRLDAPGSASGQPRSGSSASNSFVAFLQLGIEHILTGFDHLLFLLGLLIVTNRFLPALKVITCFTLAHSLTLAAATFNLVQIPTRFVEPAIAATIVYVGVENMAREEPKGRWLLTFAFGLIHGFGFASILQERGVGAGGASVAMPLLAFNLGVELGQLMVAVPVLPLVWWLRHKPVFVHRWVPVCSALVALAGAYWLIQRIWG
jgi:hydrogenase/urease accessory protein HupE